MKTNERRSGKPIALAMGFLFLAMLACGGEATTESRQDDVPAVTYSENKHFDK